MSGGFFDYGQFHCTSMAEAIESLIIKNAAADKHEKYNIETIEKFKEAVQYLKLAGEMAQRVDWLVSGDDSEGTFHERWKENIQGAEKCKK